jgi:hypothetical protein
MSFRGGARTIGPLSVRAVIGLLIAFGCSFSIPILFVYIVGPLKTNQPKSIEELFENTFSVKRNESHLRVANDETINPNISDDYLAFAWVKFNNVPKERGRVTIISKLNEDSAHRNGYALGVIRDERSVRPVAIWTDGSEAAKWMYFSEVPIIPHQWLLLAISVSRGRFVGVYSGYYSEGKGSAILHGGYDMERSTDASSTAPLRVGASRSGSFRGQLGPFGILKGPDIAEHAKELVKAMALTPNRVPRAVQSDWISLWSVDLSTSFGPKGLPVIAVDK